MEDLNDKVLGGTLQAPEWNQVPSELQNVIENTGQTLSDANLNQVGIGVAHYAANGDFYTDSGAADAYVLTVIGLKQAPDAYTDGFRIRFVADNASTGASTVDVATLGAKTFKTEGGADLAAGDIAAGDLVEADYDTASGFFILRTYVNTGVSGNLTVSHTTDIDAVAEITAASTYTPDMALEAVKRANVSGSFTLARPTSAKANACYIELTVTGAGGYTLSTTNIAILSGTFDGTTGAVNIIKMVHTDTSTSATITIEQTP